MKFKDRMKALRDSQYITQQELANYVGVSRPTISGYETKGYQPSQENLTRIAECLHVSIDFLINGGPQDIELSCFNKEADQELRAELIQLYNSLSHTQRIKVIEFTRFLCQSDDNTL